MFVHYPYDKKVWKVYDENNDFFTSRDDVFFEDQFPGIDFPSQTSPSAPQLEDITEHWDLPEHTELPSSITTPEPTPPTAPDTLPPTAPNTTMEPILSSPTLPTDITSTAPPLSLLL